MSVTNPVSISVVGSAEIETVVTVVTGTVFPILLWRKRNGLKFPGLFLLSDLNRN